MRTLPPRLGAGVRRSVCAPVVLSLLLVLLPGLSPALAQSTLSPDITSAGPFSVDEGATAVATLTATDDDSTQSELSWSKTGGADTDTFTLTSAGVLAFDAAKDYESPDDADTDGTYEVSVQVSDGSNTDSADLEVTPSPTSMRPALCPSRRYSPMSEPCSGRS